MKNVKIYLMVLLLAVVGVGEMWGCNITSYHTGCTSTIASSASSGATVSFIVTPNSGYLRPVAGTDVMYIDEEYDTDFVYPTSSDGGITWTFTMPAYDILIEINCSAAISHAVTFNTPACVTSPKGTSSKASFPTPTPRVIDGYKFEGWVTSAYNSSTRPSTIYSPGEGIPDGVTTAYALYSTVSATFDKITGTTMPVDGGNYMLCSSYNSDARVINNDINDSKHRLQTTEWNMSGLTATCTDWSCIWKFVQGTGTYSSYWFIYNEEKNKYLGVTGTGAEGTDDRKMQLRDDKDDYTAWSCSVSSGRITLTSKKRSSDTDKILKCYSTDAGIYSGGNAPYFFKQATASVNYTTSPSCSADTYTVTYAGGTGATGSVTDGNNYEFEDPVTVKDNTSPGFTKTGYNFVGWTAEMHLETADGSYDYTAGETIPAGTEVKMPAADVTFTAVWEAKTYLYGSSCVPLENITVTYNDAGTTWTRDYGVGTPVTVDSEVGSKGCTDWVFVGWQRGSAVANNSTTYTPVHNFTATAGDDEAVFYAVYDSVGTDWISALNISELKSGAEYVIVKRYADTKHYALTTTVASTNYLAGSLLGTDCETVKDASNNNRYKLKVTPTADMKWEASYVGGYWRLYNKTLGKYLNVNSSNYAFTTTTYDEFTAANGSNDSEIKIQDRGDSKYLYWYNTGLYWEGYGSAGVFGMHTNALKFTSTPPCSPRSVTFHGNGGVVSDGVNSGANLVVTEASRDAGITTPTATFADCNGKSWSFVGWSDHEIDVTRVPVLTTDMIDDGGGNKHHDISADNEEYWAVYTNQGAPETKYGKITFTQTDFIGEYTTGTKTKTIGGNDFEFSYTRMGMAAGIGIQFEAGTGVIQNTTSLGKVNYISFRGVWSGDENLSKLKIYVGETADAITTEVTSAAFQAAGDSLTFYPSANYPYVKIKSTSEYVAVTSITIGYGLGTKVWATTPDCSTITLSGDIKVTSINGQGIQAVTPVTVNANKLGASANVVLRSDNPDIYFTTNRTPNFAMAAANQPQPTATLTADAGEGDISNETVYIHYKPSSAGDGTGTTAKILATCPTNAEVSAELTVYIRNMSPDFVIATKVGGHWYALPANMSEATNPEGVQISVNEATMTATAPNTCAYTLWPVKTTNGTYDRYGTNATFGDNAYGERVRFAATSTNGSKGLWANNNASQNTLRNFLVIDSKDDGDNTASANANYEWKITTAITDGKWSYTLQSDQDNNNRYLRYWISAEGGPQWGTYSSGENNIYLLPADFYEEAPIQIVEWKASSVAVMYTGSGVTATTKVGSNSESSAQTLTAKKIDHGVFELTADQTLTANTNQLLEINIKNSSSAVVGKKLIAIPAIISDEQNAPMGLDAETAHVTDVVILDGATLSAAATKYTFKNITVYPGGKLVIGSGKQLGMSSLTLRGGSSWGAATYEHKYPQFVVNNTTSNAYSNSAAVINYDYVTTKDQYYSFVLPYNGSTSAIKYPVDIYGSAVSASNTGSFEFQYYDGAARATGATGWKVLAEPATLVAGTGYTFFGMPKKVDAYDGSDSEHAYARQRYGIHRIPMSVAANTVQSGETTDKNITIAVALATKNNDSGWNLIGNPYMSDVSGLSNTDIQVGKLVHTPVVPWDGKWQWDDSNPTTGVRYIVTTDDGETFESQQASTATLKAFKNFFVQIQNAVANTLVIPATTRTYKSLAPARYMDEVEQDIQLAVDLISEARKDKVDLLINDIYTAEFDQDGDFTKMMNSTKLNIYGVYPGDNLSFIAVDKATAANSIAVGYQVPAGGDYSLQLSDREYVMVDAIEALYVTDHEVSPEVTTNLLDGPYNFHVNNAETNDTRFTISIRLAPKTPTDIDIVPSEGQEEMQPMKFIYHDKMYILRGGVIYDATGKKVREINK